LAVQLAGHGYVVAVPEVYHNQIPAGTVLGYDDPGKEQGNACKAAMSLAAFDADVQAVLQGLLEHPACNGRLGAAGVCLGGHLAFRAALNPDIAACACFYATDLHGSDAGELGNGDTLRRCGTIRGELLLVWGRQDPHIPFEGRRRIYQALHDAGVCFTWHEFNGAHAFLRDEGERYDPAAARQAMSLALDLFQRAL
jgi:carboxymethylenebutenolidase